LKAVASSLRFEAPVVLQSMVICKQPFIGGVVVPHRDSTFLYTKPSSAIGFWFALEACTTQNGCLSFVPGSHKDGANSKRFGRVSTDAARLKAGVNNPDYNPAAPESVGPNNEHVELSFTGIDARTYADSEFVVAEVTKGTLVLIHGEVVHSSTHNHSEKSRYIYTFHVIEQPNQKGTSYPKENWLQSRQAFTSVQ
jgi:phytanoyl-CoA hydroxylase